MDSESLNYDPHHHFANTAYDIITVASIMLLFFKFYIFFKSISAKESKRLLYISFCQNIVLAITCLNWSAVSRYYLVLNYNYFYCEGPRFGLSCKSLCFIMIISYCLHISFIIASFLNRLEIVSIRNNILKNDNFFYGLNLSIALGLIVLATTIFGISTETDYVVEEHPSNFSKAEIQYYYKTSFTYIDMNGFGAIFLIAALVALALTCVAILVSSYLIIKAIKETQSYLSIETIKQHRYAFKMLLVQSTIISITISCPTATMFLGFLFTEIPSKIYELSFISFCSSYIISTLVSLRYNSAYRSTIKSIFPTMSKSTVEQFQRRK